MIVPSCGRIFGWRRFIHMGCMATTYERTFRNIRANSRAAQLHVPTTIVLPQRLMGFLQNNTDLASLIYVGNISMPTALICRENRLHSDGKPYLLNLDYLGVFKRKPL